MVFLHSSSEEYPVTTNGMTGSLVVCVLSSDQTMTTPSVNIMGSANTHMKPMLCRP